LVVFTSNPRVGGEVCSGSGSTGCPIFLERVLTTEGGGTVPEMGLNTGLVDSGSVTRSMARDGDGVGAGLMGIGVAVGSLTWDGGDAFFESGCTGGGASGTVEAGTEGRGGGGTMALVGSGEVPWARALISDARDVFFVLCGDDARGEVVIVE
jgi:hypothetical protein